MEEEIDRLNESFLQLSVRRRAGAPSEVTENGAGSSFAVISRNRTRPVIDDPQGETVWRL